MPRPQTQQSKQRRRLRNNAGLSFGDLGRKVVDDYCRRSSDFVERRILLIVGKIVIRFSTI